jgi:hypothetical protein
MKKIFVTSLVSVLYLNSYCQNKVEKIAKSIVEEGKQMYRSEMASWYGTDLFLDKLKYKKDFIGGYFSYLDKEIAKCIFFSKGDNPKLLAIISFDSTYKIENAIIDTNRKEFNSYETDLYVIRQKALTAIRSDTLFKTYNNTNLNLIPIIDKKEKKVYVLTGPKINGLVVFGNDYLLTFDKNNNIINKKELHKNIIRVGYNDKERSVASVHTHLPETGDLITSTDICTLMLYEKFAKWEKHYVVSDNYACIWDCIKNELVIMTIEDWNKFDDKLAEKVREFLKPQLIKLLPTLVADAQLLQKKIIANISLH